MINKTLMQLIIICKLFLINQIGIKKRMAISVLLNDVDSMRELVDVNNISSNSLESLNTLDGFKQQLMRSNRNLN